MDTMDDRQRLVLLLGLEASQNAILTSLVERRRERLTRNRRVWISSINRRQPTLGHSASLFHELRRENELASSLHYTAMRVTPEQFDELLNLVGPLIQRKDTRFRKCVPPSERLSITLTMMAQGVKPFFTGLHYRRGRSTIREILLDTCKALWEVLCPLHMHPITTPVEWENIGRRSGQLWDFPNCIGAVDGKHFFIQRPPNAGSEFFCYKGVHSIILVGIVDADYNFLFVDIGEAGRWNDSSVFERSDFGQAFHSGTIGLPEPAAVPDGPSLPYCLVGDEAFPLKEWLMRPYPGRGGLSLEQRVFNYRLSRVRRVVENAFGIMVSRWRIFKDPLVMEPHNASIVVKAGTVLHNFCRAQSAIYNPPGYSDVANPATGQVTEGAWRQETVPLHHLRPTQSRHASQSAVVWRNEWCRYFNTSGRRSWQIAEVTRTE